VNLPPPRTRIKICGITRVQDAVHAADAGVDAIGLVFYPHSPRVVSSAQAKILVDAVPPFVTKVGLFVNATQAQVRAVLEQVDLDVLQFHGEESPQFCAGFMRPYLKALRVNPQLDIGQSIREYTTAQGILLDTWHEKLHGGSGSTFDWSLLDPLQGVLKPATRLILAGGLHPNNVAQAITHTKPWAVDVSSGVESAPGIKSVELIKQFVAAVHSV
jgi:phosphoribosylanthranilate isomerase